MSPPATRTQELLYDEGASLSQTFILDCEDGRPTSITDVQVWPAGADDTSTEESATTGSASVESAPNTTISAAAGPAQSDPTALTLTSGSSVTIGRRYLLTEDGTGVHEMVEVASVSGTSVKLKHPLKNDYSAGSTFQSCRATIAVSTTWSSDKNNITPNWSPNPGYRVKWTVVINGQTAPYTRYADLVRYVANHGVIPLDVEQRFPGWLDTLPPDNQVDQGRDLIERAWSEVKFDLYGDGKADQALRNGEATAELVICRAMLLKIEDDILRGVGGDAEREAKAKQIYDRRYNQLIRSPVMPIDESGSGASQPVRRKAAWVR